jgi:NADP-dependent 3-hydroxy acid dehydrogenase YdfG
VNFTDRTVMLTGAAGNLGRAVAAAFAERGANLVLVDRRREHLMQAYGIESAKRLFATLDLLDQAQVDAAVKSAHERFGSINVLANLAGGFRMGEAVHETSDANWSFLFDINARTLLHASRAVVPDDRQEAARSSTSALTPL